jgi:hypothetical protein
MPHFEFRIPVSVLAGLLLSGLPFVAEGQTISSTPQSAMTTGIVGVTITQTVRLNVLNLQPVIPGVAAILCPATLELYDDTGALLKQSTVTNIPPANAASLVFKPAVPAAPAGARAQIRAVVLTPLPYVMNSGSGPISLPTIAVNRGCSLMASLEIIDDSTGATHNLTTDLRPMSAYNVFPLTTAH